MAHDLTLQDEQALQGVQDACESLQSALNYARRRGLKIAATVDNIGDRHFIFWKVDKVEKKDNRQLSFW